MLDFEFWICRSRLPASNPKSKIDNPNHSTGPRVKSRACGSSRKIHFVVGVFNMAETETKTFEAKISKLGDSIAELTLKEAVDLAEYMKQTYGIEPAAGGAMMMAPGGGAGAEVAKAEEQTEFDVILKAAGA